ncbi:MULTISPECIES: LysR substrate-binding domain-containing protein [unclassified Acidocella]|uniref:LysR substrate-binding domain-containing protein n=1 Tax=unclassified Acidocella TaxID=2648610 RepID=UPI00028C39C2|nr:MULTISPECIES: LysR substrate-binding domain-containing protein [unclassified Acidocella]EKM98189.1 LysR family transcriptional regulator [Acidocella sp. MX-AZ02]WBO61074.1 LysR substrate-binding domain-containing protein [Acidocella sp. MX-AZ03]
MELRHLRYFIAVAEERSVTVAAEKRLHTAQPSLSRQLRDLEIEIGAQLFTRGARGVELTDAGRAFLPHARIAVSEAAEAVRAARRAARPAKAVFSVGFLTGQEVDWLPHVTRILRIELPKIEFKVTSMYSPDLAEALQNGEIDLGFLRVEPKPNVTYDVIAKEPIVVILPSDHILSAEKEIDPKSLEGEILVGFSDIASVLRQVVEGYFLAKGIALTPSHRAETFSTVLSLVASLRGVALMPTYVEALLPWSVVSRPLKGELLTIDLAIGYRSDNSSPVLKTFLANLDQLIVAGPAGTRRTL